MKQADSLLLNALKAAIHNEKAALGVLPQETQTELLRQAVRDEDKKFLANFYKYAFVGLVLDWIKHDMKDDPNIIVADLSVAIHGSVSAALERYRNA